MCGMISIESTYQNNVKFDTQGFIDVKGNACLLIDKQMMPVWKLLIFILVIQFIQLK